MRQKVGAAEALGCDGRGREKGLFMISREARDIRTGSLLCTYIGPVSRPVVDLSTIDSSQNKWRLAVRMHCMEIEFIESGARRPGCLGASAGRL